MDIAIVSEKDNLLQRRREVRLNVSHAAGPTPSRKDLLPEVAKALKVAEDTVVIQSIRTGTGVAACEAAVHVYAGKEHIPTEAASFHARRLSKKAATPAGGQPAENAT